MPVNRLIFQDAEKARNSIALEQRREIKRLYSDWAEEVSDRADVYSRMTTSSSVLMERNLRDLEDMLIRSSERVSGNVEGIVKKNIRNMSSVVVSSHTQWIGSIGVRIGGSMAASYVSVPDTIVQRLVTGQIYKSGWSLSGSIWTDNQRTQKQIYEIVAGGIAQNKSVYEISKELERWVNPDKRNPWNLRNAQGRKIYPRSVDYNSQRLARTLTQHAYQQSLVESTKDNDLITGFQWVANGSRACELCLSMNGNIYPKDELPLDHPNGMCIFPPLVVDNWLEKLAEW